MASKTTADDSDENTTISFGCDYAKSSNAKCHGKSCENEISKGTLRLSRLIRNPFIPQSSTREEQLMPVYYHVPCMINYLRTGNEKKKRITDVTNDLQGFADLKKNDQDRLKKLFHYEEKLQGNLSETSSTANTTYLEHDEQKKYWQISIENKSTKTKYGLLNETDSDAIILYKEFSNQSEAKKYYQTKIKEKLKGGYTLIKQTGDTTNTDNLIGTKRKRASTPAKRTKKQATVATRKQPTRSASMRKK
ncbi:unnamed protein product [Adineta ricciae]|uniref:PARP-type domain-containing protein n=1 Tax=Adineta ricciae TaxID=249248 RepID=A0A815DPP7_ADIRI|nr:unnamed protein product [Adineta ricciae]CAF1630325.1 unnamed protein product [Adineta ricciae]